MSIFAARLEMNSFEDSLSGFCPAFRAQFAETQVQLCETEHNFENCPNSSRHMGAKSFAPKFDWGESYGKRIQAQTVSMGLQVSTHRNSTSAK